MKLTNVFECWKKYGKWFMSPHDTRQCLPGSERYDLDLPPLLQLNNYYLLTTFWYEHTKGKKRKRG